MTMFILGLWLGAILGFCLAAVLHAGHDADSWPDQEWL